MAVFKRYKGKKLKPNDSDWDKGTWIVRFLQDGVYEKIALNRTLFVTQKDAENEERRLRLAHLAFSISTKKNLKVIGASFGVGFYGLVSDAEISELSIAEKTIGVIKYE